MSLAVVAHAFYSSTPEGKTDKSVSLSLVYIVSSKAARATHRNSVPKEPTPPKKLTTI